MAKDVGLPPEFVAYARTQPFWQAQEALAHSLAYDATIMGDYSLPTERAAVGAPTIVIAGGASFPFMRETAQAGSQRLSGSHRSGDGEVLRRLNGVEEQGPNEGRVPIDTGC